MITTTCTGVQSLSCASTKFRSDVISMCVVVPMQICYPDSNKVLDTYAMQENSSKGTFLKEEIIETLGITGAETRVIVNTLNDEISQMTPVVKYLKVAGSLGKPKWIKLPRAYTKQELPTDEQEIATPEKLKRWNYLEGIANEICPNTDVSVGLLIGTNCAEALEPKDVTSSRGSGLCAVKTILGWCVVGQISCNCKNGDKVSCNRVSVKEAGS